MKTLKTILTIIVTLAFSIHPRIAVYASSCQNQAATTQSQPTCDIFCSAECLSMSTISTPLWCQPAVGYNCVYSGFNPPVNIIITYNSGMCGYDDSGTCVCNEDSTWTDITLELGGKTTTSCRG